MRGSAHESKQDAAPQGRLAQLLACEQELAELMAAATVEARRRVEDAHFEVERAEAELEAALETESERVRREVHEASQARVHEILGRAREQVARFELRSEAEIERLAALAFRRLLSAEAHG